jgi:acetyl-CoA synthetase
MGAGDEPSRRYDRANPAPARLGRRADQPGSLDWYYNVVGDGRCPIVDTWWQTETGGILITPLPGATPLKPGSATRPFFGVSRTGRCRGRRPRGATEGNLVITDSAGRARCARSMATMSASSQTYFSTYKGNYFTGDGCRRDEDGYYWITGRVDDVINVSGHRMGTAEVESALVAHEEGRRGRRGRLSARHQGPGHLLLCHADGRRGADDELRKELVKLGARRDRPHRLARPDPVGARPAEDPLGQDHAPHPAQDRRRRFRQRSATPRRWPTRRWSTT